MKLPTISGREPEFEPCDELGCFAVEGYYEAY
jgi:hypothetical protein